MLLIILTIVVFIVLILIKIHFNKKLKTIKVNKKCNKLADFIYPENLNNNNYLIRNLKGQSIGYDFNNLNQNIYYINSKKYYTIEKYNDYYLIYTNTSPRLYLNTDINGNLKLKLDKNLKGNKWLFLKFYNDSILKKMLINESGKNNNKIYEKYNFIYKNGYFIQSFDYSYFISDDKCKNCPKIENIFIIGIE